MRLEPQPALPLPTPGCAAARAVASEQARRTRAGLWLGTLGMLIFAATIPMTRLAAGSNEAPQLPPVFVAIGRAGVAGLLSLATAAVGAVLLHQRPSRGFWAFALLGAALVVAFAAWSGAGRPQRGDLLLLGAVIASSVGYITGVRVSSGADGMTPEQTISWVLVLALPVTLPVLVTQWPTVPVHAAAWGGFAYVALFSMWMGFFAWYRGLAWGGTLRVSQVQLLQPFVSILLAVPLLGERLRPATLGFSIAVMACVYLGRRMSAGAPRPRI